MDGRLRARLEYVGKWSVTKVCRKGCSWAPLRARTAFKFNNKLQQFSKGNVGVDANSLAVETLENRVPEGQLGYSRSATDGRQHRLRNGVPSKIGVDARPLLVSENSVARCTAYNSWRITDGDSVPKKLFDLQFGVKVGVVRVVL